ncbi:MAG TPA: winged helix-turn-helix transcriptional regulator [Candidatus Faecaligallichristensenella faecipullorum]|nr:winged helix-turn-helix transcriptional regulator [Candidatus Faecaligallichristensenella faecipullorum]
MEEQAKRIAELLRFLGNEHRLLILCALMEGRLTVGEIHRHTPNISASALSQHLNQMKTAGFLDSEKQGMNVFYWIRDGRVVALMEAIKEQYCEDEEGKERT